MLQPQRQDNPNTTPNLTSNVTPNQDAMSQMMNQFMQYMSAKMSQQNMMPNFQMPNMCETMTYHNMVLAQNNYGFSLFNMNQTSPAVPPLATQQSAMTYANPNQQSSWDVTSRMIQNPTFSSLTPSLPKVPPPEPPPMPLKNTPTLNQDANKSQCVKVAPSAPEPLPKSHNRVQFAIPPRNDRDDYEGMYSN
ncbi:hypothetical protein O0L34_g15368 [Tuta absoluta]|nr:hypothetical protein O0L34_g15368 [Tuta absoluta]